MRLLITGAAGMLGRDVRRVATQRAHDVLALPRAELDITDPSAVDAAIAEFVPNAVINCAAWTDVDGAEGAERAAMRVNDEGAGLLAAACAEAGALTVQISSDYVFDGGRRRPYVESDLPSPLSAYGRSKLAGETAVAATNRRHAIVRSSWLFGLGGSNFVETMLRLAETEPEVVVVSDQVGSPTYTAHLAEAVLDLTESGETGIHHAAAQGSCSWFEFCQEIYDVAGVADCSVLASSTELMERPAPRPAYSVLGSERPEPIELPDWQAGLLAYLRERAELMERAS